MTVAAKPASSIRAVAVICIHRGGGYVESCLRHLIDNGVDYAVIDNGMDADCRALLERPAYRRSLVDLHTLPFHGVFELERQIEAKERMFEALDADWLIHLDVDETMHAYVEGERLIDSIARIDAAGFNVINFDEYVFLPVDTDYAPGAAPQPLTCYYLFDPGEGPRLMRARRKSAGLSMVPPDQAPAAAGHLVFGSGLALAPESFVLRHYIVRDQAHAGVKYTRRVFSQAELSRGWHGNRAGRPKAAFDFPSAAALKRLSSPDARDFDRSDPKRQHYWDWPRP